jgi:hypothetical protein
VLYQSKAEKKRKKRKEDLSLPAAKPPAYRQWDVFLQRFPGSPQPPLGG